MTFNICINCLIQEQNNFLSFDLVKEKVLTNNFMKYYSLICNIPKYMKDCLKGNSETTNLTGFVVEDAFLRAITENKKLKFLYKNLITENTCLPLEKFLKWENVLNCEIVDWTSFFVILERCCKDTYLRSFQYKLLHRIIPTNQFLFKIHLKDTKYCSFCKAEEETIEHLFYDCSLSFNFWCLFRDCVKNIYVDFELDKKKILLGSNSYTLLLNLLTLIAKNYIYKCKLKEKLPNFTELKFVIKQYQRLEEYIAFKNSKQLAFERYWAPIQEMFV